MNRPLGAYLPATDQKRLPTTQLATKLRSITQLRAVRGCVPGSVVEAIAISNKCITIRNKKLLGWRPSLLISLLKSFHIIVFLFFSAEFLVFEVPRLRCRRASAPSKRHPGASAKSHGAQHPRARPSAPHVVGAFRYRNRFSLCNGGKAGGGRAGGLASTELGTPKLPSGATPQGVTHVLAPYPQVRHQLCQYSDAPATDVPWAEGECEFGRCGDLE